MTVEDEAIRLTDAVEQWRGHVNSMLDALSSTPEDWLREFNIPTARDAVQEFLEGGWVSDYVNEHNIDLPSDVRSVLSSLLEAIRDDLDTHSDGEGSSEQMPMA